MKNTVKKILALVFVVAMVCSLAVPAFATEETIKVNVTVVDYAGTANQKAEVTLTLKKANVEEAVKAYNAEVAEDDEDALTVAVDYSGTTGKVTKVGGLKATEVEGGKGNVFGTGYWAVALNGKLVAEDMATVTIEDGDSIVVYWNDPTFDTKLAQVDDSAIAQGIISFFYYDAEGNKMPLVDADVTITGIYNKIDGTIATGVSSWTETIKAGETATTLLSSSYGVYSATFVTDEKGQIWIAPEYLDDNAPLVISTIAIEDLEAIDEKSDAAKAYKTAELTYYNANLDRNFEDVAVVGFSIDTAALYNVAGATGDMTVVYALVAFAAVATLAAVVVMKKKSVKAN